MEGTENLEDEVFLKRHAKPEQDEKRRKRFGYLVYFLVLKMVTVQFTVFHQLFAPEKLIIEICAWFSNALILQYSFLQNEQVGPPKDARTAPL